MIRTMLLTLTLLAAAPVFAQSQPLAVPAFFAIAQKTNGVDLDFIRLRDWYTENSIFVVDIYSLGSGTGSGCTSSPVAMFNCIHSAGRNYKILGYVDTTAGSRSSSYVLNGGDGQPSVRQ